MLRDGVKEARELSLSAEPQFSIQLLDLRVRCGRQVAHHAWDARV